MTAGAPRPAALGWCLVHEGTGCPGRASSAWPLRQVYERGALLATDGEDGMGGGEGAVQRSIVVIDSATTYAPSSPSLGAEVVRLSYERVLASVRASSRGVRRWLIVDPAYFWIDSALYRLSIILGFGGPCF